MRYENKLNNLVIVLYSLELLCSKIVDYIILNTVQTRVKVKSIDE